MVDDLIRPSSSISPRFRAKLEELKRRRWAIVVSFTISMEQIGDIIERIIIDVRPRRSTRVPIFQAGMSEICDLHTRLIAVRLVCRSFSTVT
jgi:phosphate:Na+ symporter